MFNMSSSSGSSCSTAGVVPSENREDVKSVIIIARQNYLICCLVILIDN